MIKEYTAEEITEIINNRDKKERLVIEESVIKGADLEGCDLTNTTFRLCRFEDCILAGADFSDSSISGTLFLNCPMPPAASSEPI